VRSGTGLRAIQKFWNQPMWPNSHSGGFNSGVRGTCKPGKARS